MFSKIFNSAKSFINPNPESAEPHIHKVITIKSSMVNTRNKAANASPVEDELTEDNLINVYVPSGSKRKSIRISKDETSDNEVFETPVGKKRKTLPVRAKDGETPRSNTRPVVEIPAMKMTLPPAPQLQTEVPPPSTKKHKKFDNEEPKDEIFSTARSQRYGEKDSEAEEDSDLGEQKQPDLDDSGEESDDEAPEEVQKEDALKSAKSKAESAAEAVKAIQKKRKELSKKTKTTPKISSIVEEQQKDAVDDIPVEDVPTSKQLSFLQGPLPDLLPEVFLDDSAEAGQLIRFSPDDDLPRMKAKKTKFEPIVEKAPKDLRIGKTTYRVIKPSSANLAPKSAHNARSTKESWLHGRVGKTIATNRKPMNQGFFRK